MADNWEALHSIFKEHNQLYRLYAKLGLSEQKYREALKDDDEISYVYLCYKQGLHVEIGEARQIFENNIHEERIGLLIWCLGKLGLCDILINAYEQREKSMTR